MSTLALRSILIFFPVVIFASLCHATDNHQVRRLWPPTPNKYQLEFVGVFSSEADLATSKGNQFIKTVLGEDWQQNLSRPTSVTTMDANTVLVTEWGSGEIKVFDFSQKKTGNLFKRQFSLFENPVDIAIDDEDNILVADQKKGVITVFDSNLESIALIGRNFKFEKLEKIALDSATQTIYASDSVLNKVFAFDRSGQLLFEIGGGENSEAKLNSPHGLAVNREGNLYITDTGNSKIKIFDSAGNFLKNFNIKQNKGDSIIKKPWDLAFDSQEKLHIIDQGSAALITFAQNGELLFATMAKEPTNHSMGLRRPNDIHIDSKDRIIITDDLNNRFSVWQVLTQTYLAENPITEDDLEALNNYIEKRKSELAEQKKAKKAITLIDKQKKVVFNEFEKKAKKKQRKVVCPNCSKEYALIFIGLGSE
jgi:DNA-binding beta-propeller fold protein YncE